MTEDKINRRLSGIFAADMVGYSRLMEADEAGTLAALKLHRFEIVDPSIAEFSGRIVKTTGDGMLVEFASVVDAVSSAVAIQRAMVERNKGVPEARRIRFRIGINLGDIIIDGDDIYGDGVNIAARLEQLSEPGGVCVSGTAYEHLKANVDVGYADLGAQHVKNIEKPVRVYRVLLEPNAAGNVVGPQMKARSWHRNAVVVSIGACLIVIAMTIGWLFWQSKSDPAVTEAETVPLANNSSIAVLPFQNMSDDTSQIYFADGIAEDIITDLSKISGVFIIARNTSFQYRDQAMDVAKVGRELGVRYVLEGSVRRAGNEVRINAQLIDTTTGGHVWADRYDGTLADVFSVQDQVASRIIDALKPQLSSSERQAVVRRDTDNPQAYDAYLRGLKLLSERRRINVDGNRAAQAAFEEAIRADPDYALAYAGLGWTKWLYVETINADERQQSRAFELARKSIELNDNALAHRVLAREHFSLMSYWVSTTKNMDLAVAELEAAARLQPNDPDVLADLSIALNFAGRPREAAELAQEAMKRNPHHPNWYFGASGIADLFTGETQEAVRDLKKWSDANSNWNVPYVFLAAALALSGEEKRANLALRKYDQLGEGFRLAQSSKHKDTKTGLFNIRTTFHAIKRRWPLESDEENILLEGLSLAGMKERPG
ncbi:MAG: hypothetical protein GY789_29545 [Hyphomicrobiales bacterium]|nr:hypothetical protein [Hyphomicrobiales bacterium]